MVFLQQKIVKTLLVFSTLSLSACSQQFSAINDTLNEAINGIPDVALSKQAISDLPYASTYVRINDGSRVFMVLAFVDTNPQTGNQQLKWVSTDKAVIVTENGRIVHTSLLPIDNLAQFSSPILTAQWGSTTQWQGTYDWQNNYHYGYQASAELSQIKQQSITSVLWKKETTLWQENIHFPQLKQTIQNQYWLDKDNKVVKSIQYIGPKMTKIEMEVLKGFGGK